jgi:hypothetical protein
MFYKKDCPDDDRAQAETCRKWHCKQMEEGVMRSFVVNKCVLLNIIIIFFRTVNIWGGGGARGGAVG